MTTGAVCFLWMDSALGVSAGDGVGGWEEQDDSANNSRAVIRTQLWLQRSISFSFVPEEELKANLRPFLRHLGGLGVGFTLETGVELDRFRVRFLCTFKILQPVLVGQPHIEMG